MQLIACPLYIFFFRVVEAGIQSLDQRLTGLQTKVLEEGTPSLTPASREGRAMSRASAV